MKVFISSDIEGTAGIVDWQLVRASGADYELGRRLLTDEVNAAIDGAARAGATQFLVNDSHSTMQNIRPNALHHNASYVSGRHKPVYMMEGLDGTFDAVFMVAYHGSVGAEHAILSHTYNPLAVWEARLNGTAVGESALNALVALHHRVPVVLITGDDATAEEAQPFLPGVEAVVVKRSRIRGVERAGARVVTITDDEPLRLYRTFVTIISLTRSIVER
jgi:D-amino peptidase